MDGYPLSTPRLLRRCRLHSTNQNCLEVESQHDLQDRIGDCKRGSLSDHLIVRPMLNQ